MNLRKQLSSYIALNNYVEAIRENTSSIVLTDAITNGLTDLQLKGSEVKNKPETFLDYSQNNTSTSSADPKKLRKMTDKVNEAFGSELEASGNVGDGEVQECERNIGDM